MLRRLFESTNVICVLMSTGMSLVYLLSTILGLRRVFMLIFFYWSESGPVPLDFITLLL